MSMLTTNVTCPKHRRRIVVSWSAAALLLPLAASSGELIGMDLPDRVPNEFIVRLSDSSVYGSNEALLKQELSRAQKSAQYATALAAASRRVQEISTRLSKAAGANIEITSAIVAPGFVATMSDDAATAMAADPDVKAIYPNVYLPNVLLTTQSPTPDWGLDRIDQRERASNNAYKYGATGEGVHIYILDSGIRTSHEEFEGRASNDRNLVGDGYSNSDCHGHGTQVASLAGGKTYGAAKKARLHGVKIVKCDGGAELAHILAGLEWVYDNATRPAVVNISSRWVPADDLRYRQFQADAGAWIGAIQYRRIPVVAAAGNSGNNDSCAWIPSGFGNVDSQQPDITVVGASTSADRAWVSSSWGQCVDLYAPGDNITTAWRTSDSAKNPTDRKSGTSLAAPYVSGVYALYLQNNPNNSANWAQHQIVEESATRDALIGLNTNHSYNRLLYALVPGNDPNVPGGGGPPPPVDPEPKIEDVLSSVLYLLLE
jgi:subtilisin family serine protease